MSDSRGIMAKARKTAETISTGDTLPKLRLWAPPPIFVPIIISGMKKTACHTAENRV